MSTNYSYTPGYFEIEDILATQERTSCKFLIDVPKLGKLNPATEEVDLKAGTVLDLPMWLAQSITMGRHPIVAASLPKVYKEAYQEIVKADPCAVDLSKLGAFFYELGLHSKQFDVRGDVIEGLIHTFKTRFRQIMDLADNIGSDPSVQNRLDRLEKNLFLEGHKARSKLNAWLINSSAPIVAADMVINHKKRKRAHLEKL